MNSSCRHYVLSVVCLTAIGCGPGPQPVWNKDSRSFFFSHSDGSVAQYDLDKKASRTLLAPGDQQVMQVALSPTQPVVALTPAALGLNGRAVRVGFAPQTNGNVTWNKTEEWGDPKAKRDICASSCYWCPTGQRILIWYQQSGEIPGLIKSATPFGRFAVYDVKTQSLSELTTAPPAVILGQVLHVSPLCPDGSGYLAMKLGDKGVTILFVSWDGWEYPLVMEEVVAAQLNAMADSEVPKEKKPQMFFPMPQGRWSENILRFSIRTGTIAIDPKNRKIKVEPLTVVQKQEFDRLTASDTDDAPWTTIQVAPFQGSEYALHCRQKMGDGSLPARIELVDNKLQGRRVLFEGNLPENFMVHHLIPSPDGQLVLACLRVQQNCWIYVVQADGTVLAKVDAGPSIGKGR